MLNIAIFIFSYDGAKLFTIFITTKKSVFHLVSAKQKFLIEVYNSLNYRRFVWYGFSVAFYPEKHMVKHNETNYCYLWQLSTCDSQIL